MCSVLEPYYEYAYCSSFVGLHCVVIHHIPEFYVRADGPAAAVQNHLRHHIAVVGMPLQKDHVRSNRRWEVR